MTGKWAQKCFIEALDGYCNDPDGLRGALRSEYEVRQRHGQMKVFAEFMGDLQLCKIDGDTLRAYRDGPLKTIPGSVNKLPKAIRQESMKATIEALREDGREWLSLSDAMQQERMAHLAGLFKWLERKSYLKPNPAEGLRGETGMTMAEQWDQSRCEKSRVSGEDDADSQREQFTADQLVTIFGQLDFQLGHGRHVKKPAYWYPFEFWLPLLGLYAGIRIKEGAQLHLRDVRQVAGVWVLDINQITRDKSLKNNQSVRLIPIHLELIRLGFLVYCDRLRVEGFQRVFPELTYANSPAKYAKEPGRKMSSMLEKLGMPRDGTRVFHSLRHNCNNTLLRVPSTVFTNGGDELKRYVRLHIMGHNVGDDANTVHYTDAKPEELAALMAGVSFNLPVIAQFDIEFGLLCVRAALNKKTGDRYGTEDMGPLGNHVPGVAGP
jgi:integrase